MRRWLIIVLFMMLAGILTTGIILGFGYFVPDPPAREIESARQALANARNHRAGTYSKELYDEASLYLDSAMILWRNENNRLILKRDYSRVLSLAELSVQKSNESLNQTRSQSADLKKRSVAKLETLNHLLDEINTVFYRFPLQKETRKNITKGKLLLNEGKVALNKSEYIAADKKFTAAEVLIKNAHKEAHALITDFFRDHDQWQKMMDQTIAESKKKRTTAIIVDKFASKCYVYKHGKKTIEFDAELGKNWVGDKHRKGDHATPEGRYRITRKKEGRETKYHKALLIDYPNEDDKKRFNKAIASGTIPAGSKIGGLIEIHGHGGKGTDWTEGCVALTDSDMDKLYKMVRVGTAVTIIGSIPDLGSVLRK